MFKRIMSLLLALVMMISMVPVSARAATDYSDYSFYLLSTSETGGSCGALYVEMLYLEYTYWPNFTLSSINYGSDRFATRVRFEKDSSTGKYRLFFYATSSGSPSLTSGKYYLTGETFTNTSSAESSGLYYGETYGYKYVGLGSSSEALLWEVTSSGYLKTTYENQTHYLWSTVPMYGSAKYLLRLRTSTTATGNYGVPYNLTKYGNLQDSSYHVHTPGASEQTAVDPATCVSAEKQYLAIKCKDTSCGTVIASATKTTGSKDPSNHTELTTRVANEQAATCQTPYTYEIETYCTGCQAVTETAGPFEEGELGDHVPGTPVAENETAGTCTTSGSYESAVYCSVCQTELSRETVDSGLGDHIEVIDEAVEAGCTATGLTEGKHCSVCNEILLAQTVVNALGHEEVTDAAVEPSCAETGLTEGKHCDRCGEILEAQTAVDALGHSFGNWTVTTAAGCTEDGEQRRECIRCGLVETGTLEAVGHSYEAAVTDPGCETGGYTTHTCTACGDSYTDSETEALGHAFGGWMTVTEATCIRKGQEQRQCGSCGCYETRETETVGHTEQTLPAVEANCTRTGLTEGKQCSVCGEILLAQETIPINGVHSFEDNACIHCGVPGGSCGTATWIFDRETGTLTITGDGMFDHSHEDCSFDAFAAQTRRLVIGEGITGIGAGQFAGWPLLTEVSLPETLEEIGAGAFESCPLTEITIPKGVQRIGEGAFADNTDLEKIIFAGDAPQIIPDPADPDGTIRPPFEGVTAATEYPAENPTWTPTVMEDLGGDLEWVCESCRDGHVEVTDEAVAATCTETGLTEGRHCSVCNQILLKQESIAALGHTYVTVEEKTLCTVCGAERYFVVPQEYIALYAGQEYRILTEISPAELQNAVQWRVEEGCEHILEVENGGMIRALQEGSAYILGSLTDGDTVMTARCRVDVTQKVPLDGILLSTRKLTAELYSTGYAALDILLLLPQNYPAEESGLTVSQSAAMTLAGFEDRGVAVEELTFTDPEMARLFDLQILDDRRVAVIPTEDAVRNPGQVKSKYVGSVTATVQGESYTSDELTLTVKKSTPKLKASIASFNSFYTGQSRQITVSGGTAVRIYEDPSVARPIPEWLRMEGDTLILTEDAPAKNTSEKAYLMIQTEEWRIPAAVTLNVKNVYKAPGLKLSAASVTMTSHTAQSDGIALQLQCRNKNDSLESLHVTDLTAPEGYRVENFDPQTGSFLLKAEGELKPGKIPLAVCFGDTSRELSLMLTVRAGAVTLKLARSSVELNIAEESGVRVGMTAAPADYCITEPVMQLKDSKGNDRTGQLQAQWDGQYVRISKTDTTLAGETYKLQISAGGSKAVTLTVKTLEAVPTVSLKAKENIDLSFPEQTAVVTASFKNYSGSPVSYTYSVSKMEGQMILDEHAARFFAVEQGPDNTFLVRCTQPDDVSPGSTYILKLNLTLESGRTLVSTVKLTVKRTQAKLKLSASKVSLNKLTEDWTAVAVTCSTKGYVMAEGPRWKLLDSTGKASADGKLTVWYDSGMLYLAVNDQTDYGQQYKLEVRADDYGPSSVLTVTIPARSKSLVQSSLKVKGKIDVIRKGTAVTVTPAYKNCTEQTGRTEELSVYCSADNYSVPVNHLFRIDPNGDGSYCITRAPGAELDHTLKYKVKIVTTFDNSVKVESTAAAMTVAMGSANLTIPATDTTLFARDRYDRVVFRVTAKDTALNGALRMEIRDAKYRDLFEVYDYGDGTFAVGFRDGKVHSSLTGKNDFTTVSLKLNVWLEGNQTAKANTTVTLKLSIRK